MPRNWLGRVNPNILESIVYADHGGIAVGRDICDSTITVKSGLDEGQTGRLVAEALGPFAEKMAALADQVARDKGIPGKPLRAVLLKLGHAHVPDHEIPARLDAAADQLIELRMQLGRLSNDRPELTTIRKQALALIDRGDFDGAREALHKGREAAQALREEASRNEAEFLADEARLDNLQFAYRATATKYAEAAALVAPFDRNAEWNYFRQQAGALCSYGRSFGDNNAVVDAITIYQRALTLVPRTQRPLDWAATQTDLGAALMNLSETAQTTQTDRLEEAVAAFHEALKERTRERDPLGWAETQSGLGFSLWALGCRRRRDTSRLQQDAVAAFRAALQECTRDRAPLLWANIQKGLGNALAVLSWSERGTTWLQKTARTQESVAAYHALARPFAECLATGRDRFFEARGSALVITQPYQYIAKVVLGPRPFERLALTALFLQRLAIGRH
jgi:tetratricopeptide (TPR) repeat protein